MDIPIITIGLKRSLLPLLCNTLSWLMGTATTKDVNNIKKRVNQLIEAQSTQQVTFGLHCIHTTVCSTSKQT